MQRSAVSAKSKHEGACKANMKVRSSLTPPPISGAGGRRWDIDEAETRDWHTPWFLQAQKNATGVQLQEERERLAN